MYKHRLTCWQPSSFDCHLLVLFAGSIWKWTTSLSIDMQAVSRSKMKGRSEQAGWWGAGSEWSGEASGEGGESGVPDSRAVVICGFGELGQTLANMLESPLAMSLERGRVPYIAFDLQPSRLRRAREAGFNVLYGDASRQAVRCCTPPAPLGLGC